MKIQLTILLFIIAFKVLGSTPQVPATLIYNGSEYEWHGQNPGIDFFQKNNFKPPKDAIESTANYGYFLYTYSIFENCLYLTDVRIYISIEKDGIPELEEKSVFKRYFPKKERILMQNYTDILTIPYGKEFKTVKKGWNVYNSENYFVFDIENGVLIQELDLSFENYQRLKKEQINKLKNSNSYESLINENKENFERFNKYRDEKYTLEEYLEYNILYLIDHLH